MLHPAGTKEVIWLWRHHFSTLLQGIGDINAATREDSEPAPIDDDGIEMPPPSHNEVRFAIQRLKNNKAVGPDGLPAKLFKAGGDISKKYASAYLHNMAGRKHAQRLEP